MPSDHPVDHLAERYGRRGQNRATRTMLVAGLVLLVAVVAWFVWILWVALNPKVSSGLETWEAVDENTVEVTIRVSVHDEGVTPTCSLKAEDAYQMKVGELVDFEAEPGRQTLTVPTERKADRVEWIGCTADGQKNPK